MTEKIFSQDRGLGLDDKRDATWASAADFAALAEQGDSAFVVEGFDFEESDVDESAETVTVPAGQAVLHETGLDDGRTAMEWLRGAFPVRYPETTEDLATTGDTDVWIDATIKGTTTPNDVSIVTGSTPSEPRLRLGTVFEDGTVELTNRAPSKTFDTIESSEVSTTSLDAGSLDNGVAGSGNSISKVHGDGGEIHPVIGFRYAPGQTFSVTSTSYSELASNTDRWVDPNAGFGGTISNFGNNSYYKIWFRAVSFNDGATELLIRVRGSPDTSVTVTDGGSSYGYGDFGQLEEMNDMFIEGQVDTGSVDVRQITVVGGVMIDSS